MIKKFNNFKINEGISEDNITLCCVDLYDNGFGLVSFSDNEKLGLNNAIVLEKNTRSEEHPSNLIRTIILKGENFEEIKTFGSLLDNEYNELIELAIDSGIKLKYYSGDYREEPQITILTHCSGITNTHTFETIYITKITIMYFL